MTVSELAPAQVADWAAQVRASGLTPYVLDVREDWERDAAHVQPQAATQGFVLLTEPLSRLGASLDRLPDDPDTPIACLCHHGVRSFHVAHFLAQQGHDAVWNITGGIDAWALIDPAIGRD